MHCREAKGAANAARLVGKLSIRSVQSTRNEGGKAMGVSQDLSATFYSMVADLNNFPAGSAQFRQYLDDQVVMVTPRDGAIQGAANVIANLVGRAPEAFGPTFTNLSITTNGNSGNVSGVGPFTDHDNDLDQPADIHFTFQYLKTAAGWIVKRAQSTRN
jgi:hypothetical protein